MADKKITQFSELTGFGAYDKILVVDVSDTTMAPSGTTKFVDGGALLNYLSTFFASVTAVQGATKIVSEHHEYYTGGLTFKVYQVEWLNAGQSFSQNFNEEITLSNGDDYYPRIDVVVLDLTDNTLDVVEGEAVADVAATPSLLPTQLALFSVNVPALATSLSGITNTLLWDEDLGDGYGEWDAEATGTVVVGTFDDASNGSLGIKFPAGTNNQYVTLSTATPLAISNGALKFSFKQATEHAYQFQIVLQDTTTGTTYPYILISGNSYGLDSTSTVWQDVFISLPGVTQLDQVRIVNQGNTNISFFDEIYIQSGGPAAEVTSYLPTGGYNGTAQDLYDLIIANAGGSGSTKVIYTSAEGAVDDADISLGSTDFGTDNHTVLQGILDEAASNPILVIWDGAYSVSDSLQIRSNTTIWALPGCGAILRNNSNDYLLRNKNLTLSETDYANIVDENISIIGGIWNGNGYNTGTGGDSLIDASWGSGVNGSAQYRTVDNSDVDGDFYDLLGMKGVRNLVVRDATFYASRNFMVGLRLCENYHFDNCLFDFGDVSTRDTYYYDGVHVFGPCRKGVLQNLTFRNCKDDNISLVADGSNGDLTFGDITDIFINNITFEDTAYGFRFSSSTNLLDEITVDGVHGETTDYLFLVDDLIGSAGNIGTININNVTAKVTSSPNQSQNSYMVINCKADVINVSNWTRQDFSQNYTLIRCNAKANVRALNLINLNYYLDTAHTADVISIGQVGAIMREINIIGGNFYNSGTEQNFDIVSVSNGTLNRLQFKGLLSVEGIRYIVNHTGGTLTGIYADSVRHGSVSTGASFTTTGTVSYLMINGYVGHNLYSGAFSNLEGAHFNILKVYTPSGLPPTTLNGEGNSKMILVDLTSSKVPCYTNGSNWINMIDGSTIVGSTLDLTKIVRYYKFNNDVTDAEGLGDGTATGITYNASGKVDDSAVFANSPDYVSIPDAADLSFGNGTTDAPFSISAWVKPSSLSGPQTIFDKRGNGSPNEYATQINGSVLRFVIWDSSTGGLYDTRSTDTLSTGTWQHICFTYDGSGTQAGMKLYLDGTEVTYNNTSSGSYTAMENTTATAMIGDTSFNPGGADFNGEMDEVTLWSVELSSSQIAEIISTNNAGNSLY